MGADGMARLIIGSRSVTIIVFSLGGCLSLSLWSNGYIGFGKGADGWSIVFRSVYFPCYTTTNLSFELRLVLAVELVLPGHKRPHSGVGGWFRIPVLPRGVLQWFHAANPKCLVVMLCVTFSLSVCGMAVVMRVEFSEGSGPFSGVLQPRAAVQGCS